MRHLINSPESLPGVQTLCVTGLIFLIIGCAGGITTDNESTSLEPEHQAFISPPKLVETTFERARILVEEATDSQLKHVTLRLVTNREIQQRVTQETRRLVNNEFEHEGYADKFLTRIVGDQTGSYAALYVGQTKQILVSSSLLKIYLDSVQPDSELEKQALLALLIHELVHAADDQHYGIHENRVLTFKASFTQSAAFEGHAQMITRSICAANDCLPGLQALDNFMFDTAQLSDPIAQSVQAVSRNVLEYSYVEGERFLTALRDRPDGDALIANVLTSPPDDPVQILVPETYPDYTREARNNRLITAATNLEHDWSRYPWATVETSPIKGINVRHNPDRRMAAVEGFTELIVAMAGAQLYNQNATTITPIEVMIIETESTKTARLFTDSFISRSTNKAEIPGPLHVIERLKPMSQVHEPTDYHVYIMQDESARPGMTLVGMSGNYVIQVSGADPQQQNLLRSYGRSIIQSLAGRSDRDVEPSGEL